MEKFLEQVCKALDERRSEIHTKTMFGGHCAWLDGPPGSGSMIGGVTSKLEVCLRTNADTRDEVVSAGGRPMMGAHQPWYLVSQKTFFANASRMVLMAAQAARSGKTAKKPATRSKAPESTVAPQSGKGLKQSPKLPMTEPRGKNVKRRAPVEATGSQATKRTRTARSQRAT